MDDDDASGSIRVAVADDSFLMREAMRQVLDRLDGDRGRGDLRARRRAARRRRPRAPGRRRSPTCGCRRRATTRASAIAHRLRAHAPGVGVVVLSQYAEPRYGLGLLERRRRGPRVPAQGARRRPRPSCARRSRSSRAAARSSTRRWCTRCMSAAARGDSPLAAADAARARGPRRDGPGQEQRGDRRDARADQARGREARRRDLPAARAAPTRRSSAGASRRCCCTSASTTSGRCRRQTDGGRRPAAVPGLRRRSPHPPVPAIVHFQVRADAP